MLNWDIYNAEALEPPEERKPAEGCEWSPKDDDYGDMRYDMYRDDGI